MVVPRKGDVDRNGANVCTLLTIRVVPRKGDVDRNKPGFVFHLAGGVVPRKGDVDRNRVEPDNVFAVKCRPPQGGRG